MTASRDISIAANNGDIGGGEVMLLNLAAAMTELGNRVTVVAPSSPSDVVDAARSAGHGVAAIEGATRRSYARNLRAWDRTRTGLLWCNGLLPATATAGHRSRVVHVHQIPTSPAQRLALAGARRGADLVVVPSAFAADRIPGARVLANWVTAPEMPADPSRRTTPTIGFLGRATRDKGIGVLLTALTELPPAVRLVVAGANRFGTADDAAEFDARIRPLVDRVALTGWVTPGEFFSSVDLAVFPSVQVEAFGLVVAEAMAGRVPFVVSDAGALPEVAGPDYPWVSRADDPVDLARVIGAALAAPDDQRQRTTARAFDRWRDLFSPDAGRRNLAALLEAL